VEVRYPGGTILLNNDQVYEAIETSRLIRKVVCKKLNLIIGINKIIDF